MIRLTDLSGNGSFTMGGKKFEYGKVYSNPYAKAFNSINEAEGEDHEVSMAQNQLDAIIKYATELKKKMGEGEKEIPAWIQDHISKSENYISQASNNYHEYGDSNEGINEASDEELIKNMQITIKDLETKLRTTKDSKEREMIKKNIAVNTGLLNWWKTRKEVVSEAGPCWKGYKQVGMKTKNGKEVPNCVPEGVVREISNKTPKIFVKTAAVEKKIRELMADRKRAVVPYNNETDPAKKEKLKQVLIKLTNQIKGYEKNLVQLRDMEEEYLQQMHADAELDTSGL